MPLAVLIGGLIFPPANWLPAAGGHYQSQRHEHQKLLVVLSQFGLIFAIATVARGSGLPPTLSQN